MRRLCALQIALALAGWFYTTKAPLPSYPGAFTFTVDGPFKTEQHCQAALDDFKDVLAMLGMVGQVQVSACFERKDA